MVAIDTMPPREFVFGSILLLANKLQIVGDGLMEGLTLKQWFLLMMLNLLQLDMGDEPATVSHVAEFTETSRQNVKKMLEVLQRKGFVTLSPSVTDHRALDVQLTPQSFEFFNRNEQLGEDFLKRLYRTVSDDDLQTVDRVFRQLFAELETMTQTPLRQTSSSPEKELT